MFWAAGSLLYLIWHRDIPAGLWDQAFTNHELAVKLLRRIGQESEAVKAELNFYLECNKAGKHVDNMQIRNTVSKIMESSGVDTGVNMAINNLSVSFRNLGELDIAEYLALSALALDEQLRDENDPLISQRLNNLSIIYLLKKEYPEARDYNSRAWKHSGEKWGLTTVQMLIIRIILEMCESSGYGDYLGQLKSFMENTELLHKANEKPSWGASKIIEFIQRNLPNEKATFFATLIEVINNQEKPSKLDDWDFWKMQNPISLAIPWPSNI